MQLLHCLRNLSFPRALEFSCRVPDLFSFVYLWQQHTGISPNHVPEAVRYWRGRPGFVLGPVLRPIPGPAEARVRGKLGEFPVSCTPAILESSDSYMHILKLLVADLRYQQIDLNE